MAGGRAWGVWGALVLLLAMPSLARAGDLSPSSFDPGPERYPNVVVQNDVPIEMRDGVRLYADVYRPADASGVAVPGRFPVVLNQVVFNKSAARLDGSPAGPLEDNGTGYTPLFVRHGYVQVIADARGTGSSAGEWDMFGAEAQRDMYDVARWLVRQPFSDGRFVGYGASCMAIAQVFLGAQRPPGLKALFPIVPMDDIYRDVAWHGGGLDAPFGAVWHGLVTSTKVRPPGYAAGDPEAAAETLGSRASPGANEHTTRMLTEPYDGDYYRERSPGRVVGQVDVPTFVVGGWYDLMQRGTPRIYDGLRLPPGRKQLLMGPWYHMTGGEGLGEPGTPPPLDVLALAWFDRWVKGKRNGIEDYGPVTVQQLGSDRWETFRQYPRRDVRYERFHLSGERSGSARSLNDGSLTTTASADAGSDSMPGNTVNGICTRSTVQWSVFVVPPGQPCETDNRSQEATSLTYTTPPLEEPLHLSGPLSLTLNGSTTARDTTWIATVADVAPGGESTQITAGWLIQSRRALDAARTTFAPNGDPVVPWHPFTRESVLPVEPGATDTMAIEILNTDAVVQPGHRLRVTVSSGDVPHLLVPADTAVAGAGGTSTVHRGGGSPSFLTAAVAPLGPEPAPHTRTKLQRCRSKAKRAHRP
ncbi:MAG: CocE/NonD family hydrolase, partial [Actinomycetota bacterium]|nr:CocE/NonD family hydrolase [Actinomycetota bacterium]